VKIDERRKRTLGHGRTSASICNSGAGAQHLKSTTTTAKRILFFSLEDWNEIWRRNQFICAELCRRHPDLSVLWVGQTVDLSYAIVRGDFVELGQPQLTPHIVPDLPQIHTIKPVKLLPNKIGKGLNRYLYGSAIKAAIVKSHWHEQEFDMWVNDQQAANLLPLANVRKVIYDITDDWTELPQSERSRNTVIENDRNMLTHADHVIVCSQKLFETKRSKCKSLSLIPNGVDDWRYHPDVLTQLEAEPPADIRGLSKPIVGYTGTLHSARLDLQLIAACANKLPQCSFVFVGPNSLTAEEIASIQRPNVHILGAKAYADLPKYIAAFDACMTPHLVTPFTDSLDPLKLYEYMSTGKPAISTPCAGFRDLRELVAIASTADEFCAAIHKEIDEADHTKARERIAWARQHSWAARVSEIEKILGWN
jgi:glycosyltransferase involved in cell wall biosynthesis